MAQPHLPRNYDGPTINVQEPAQVRYWTDRLGCTTSALREAVEEVGPAIEDIEEYLAEGEE